jgi:hypothetical protein
VVVEFFWGAEGLAAGALLAWVHRLVPRRIGGISSSAPHGLHARTEPPDAQRSLNASTTARLRLPSSSRVAGRTIGTPG